jgi:hypothetical protein
MQSPRRELRVSVEVEHLEPGILHVGRVSSPVPQGRQSATKSACDRLNREAGFFGNLDRGLTVEERHLQ